MSYTKLPIYNDHIGYVSLGNGKAVAEFFSENDGSKCIQCSTEERDANARLFVHAGKMLEMLEEMCVAIYTMENGTPPNLMRLANRAANVTRSARGE